MMYAAYTALAFAAWIAVLLIVAGFTENRRDDELDELIARKFRRHGSVR